MHIIGVIKRNTANGERYDTNMCINRLIINLKANNGKKNIQNAFLLENFKVIIQ